MRDEVSVLSTRRGICYKKTTANFILDKTFMETRKLMQQNCGWDYLLTYTSFYTVWLYKKQNKSTGQNK